LIYSDQIWQGNPHGEGRFRGQLRPHPEGDPNAPQFSVPHGLI